MPPSWRRVSLNDNAFVDWCLTAVVLVLCSAGKLKAFLIRSHIALVCRTIRNTG